MTIKYEASAHFDMETEIEVPENATEDDVLLAIMNDLMDRYDLFITVERKGENHENR